MAGLPGFIIFLSEVWHVSQHIQTREFLVLFSDRLLVSQDQFLEKTVLAMLFSDFVLLGSPFSHM